MLSHVFRKDWLGSEGYIEHLHAYVHKMAVSSYAALCQRLWEGSDVTFGKENSSRDGTEIKTTAKRGARVPYVRQYAAYERY